MPFPRVSVRVSVIARLEFELAYYDIAVQHFIYDATGTTSIHHLNSIETHEEKAGC